MALLTKGYELYREMLGRNEQLRAEGRAEGRAEARAEIIEQLRDKGINVDDLLPPDESDTEPPATP
jgi:predicted transposase YdaD